MKSMDTNGDGKISVEELIEYITKGASQLLAKSAGAGASVFAQAQALAGKAGMSQASVEKQLQEFMQDSALAPALEAARKGDMSVVEALLADEVNSEKAQKMMEALSFAGYGNRPKDTSSVQPPGEIDFAAAQQAATRRRLAMGKQGGTGGGGGGGS